MAEWAHYSTPNEEFLQALAKAMPIPALTSATADAVNSDQEILRRQRIVVETMLKAVEAMGPPVGITVEEKRVPVTSPPGDILVRIYTPESQDAADTFPVLLYMHGGGYCLGTLDSEDSFCRSTSAKQRIVVVNVDYRLAPQFPFPTGIEDSYDTLTWVAKHAAELRADLKKGFIVGGTSAGGNFTCVITQRARNDPELRGKITGQLLQVPATLFYSSGYPEKFKDKIISYEQNKSDPILTRANLSLFEHGYEPGDQSDPRVSPLLAESFEGLPPAYVQISGADPLRDEGLLYARALQEAGVPTKVDVYPGVPHGFAKYYPQISLSAKWRADVDAGVMWLLDGCRFHAQRNAADPRAGSLEY